MIEKNVPQKLRRNVLFYWIFGSPFSNAGLSILVFLGFLFITGYVRNVWQGEASRNMGSFEFYLFIFSVLIVIFYVYLKWKMFEFSVSDTSITIRSGVFFRHARTINFNDTQNAQLRYGPVSMLFGVKILQAYTASPGQAQTISSKHGSYTIYRPDINICLPSVDAEEVLRMIPIGDVQKVQNIQNSEPAPSVV